MRNETDSFDDMASSMRVAREQAITIAHAMMVEDCGPGAKLAGDYAIQMGFEDYESFDPRDPEHWPDFDAWARDLAAARVDEEADRILEEVTVQPDGILTVWREMIVPRGWIEDEMEKAPLGKCWSWDPSFAIAHQGHGWNDPDRMTVKMQALVPVDDIDWDETLALNAAGEYTVGDEKEIRLLDEAVVEVIRIERAAFDQPYDDGGSIEFSPAVRLAAGSVPAPAAIC